MGEQKALWSLWSQWRKERKQFTQNPWQELGEGMGTEIWSVGRGWPPKHTHPFSPQQPWNSCEVSEADTTPHWRKPGCLGPHNKDVEMTQTCLVDVHGQEAGSSSWMPTSWLWKLHWLETACVQTCFWMHLQLLCPAVWLGVTVGAAVLEGHDRMRPASRHHPRSMRRRESYRALQSSQNFFLVIPCGYFL